MFALGEDVLRLVLKMDLFLSNTEITGECNALNVSLSFLSMMRLFFRSRKDINVSSNR